MENKTYKLRVSPQEALLLNSAVCFCDVGSLERLTKLHCTEVMAVLKSISNETNAGLEGAIINAEDGVHLKPGNKPFDISISPEAKTIMLCNLNEAMHACLWGLNDECGYNKRLAPDIANLMARISTYEFCEADT